MKETQNELVDIFMQEFNKKKKKEKQEIEENNIPLPNEDKENYLAGLPITEFENSGGGALRPKRHVRRVLGQSK